MLLNQEVLNSKKTISQVHSELQIYIALGRVIIWLKNTLPSFPRRRESNNEFKQTLIKHGLQLIGQWIPAFAGMTEFLY